MSHAPRHRPTRPAVIAPVTLLEFEALDQTHAQVLLTLRQLEKLVDRLDREEPDDAARSAATAICAFFDGTARSHHEEEERVVFPPLLRGRDAALIQHVQRLQQDHGWLEEDWHELRPMLATIGEGYAWHEPESLRQMAAVFSALYLEHIALEETLVYPAAKARLTAAETAEQRRTNT